MTGFIGSAMFGPGTVQHHLTQIESCNTVFKRCHYCMSLLYKMFAGALCLQTNALFPFKMESKCDRMRLHRCPHPKHSHSAIRLREFPVGRVGMRKCNDPSSGLFQGKCSARVIVLVHLWRSCSFTKQYWVRIETKVPLHSY